MTVMWPLFAQAMITSPARCDDPAHLMHGGQQLGRRFPNRLVHHVLSGVPLQDFGQPLLHSDVLTGGRWSSRRR